MEELRNFYESKGHFVTWNSLNGNVVIDGKSYSPDYLKSLGGYISTEGETLNKWLLPKDVIGFALEGDSNIASVLSEDYIKLGGIKRFEFVLGKITYQFVLNPEEYSLDESNKVTVTRTKGGTFADEFGKDTEEISFSGTTGFINGFTKFKELRDIVLKAYELRSADHVTTTLMEFYNYTDEHYFRVIPERFSLKRSKSKPLLYAYDIKLVCMSKLDEPAGFKAINQIGNPYKAVSTITSYGERNNIPQDFWGVGTVNTKEYGWIKLDSKGNIIGKGD